MAINKHEARSVDDGIALKLDYLMVAQLYKSTIKCWILAVDDFFGVEITSQSSCKKWRKKKRYFTWKPEWSNMGDVKGGVDLETKMSVNKYLQNE